jgi:2-polyprenyl-3-methyl-5-hydroxy-6-metoxy-1,4-benzoquinol methylase
MKNIVRKSVCLICNKTKFIKTEFHPRDSEKHLIVQCLYCQHFQIEPIPNENELKNFYDHNQQSKMIEKKINLNLLKQRRMSDTKRRLNFVIKHTKKNGRILEIGSGYGLFLNELKKYGFLATGIEISKLRRKISQKFTDAEILDVNLLKTTPKMNKFDTIVMFQVLEHINEPTVFLKNLKKLLKKSGKLIIEVPNISDFQITSNIFYNKWFWQLAHINYFSPSSLKTANKKSGFKNIQIKGVQRYSIKNMFYWNLFGKPELKTPSYDFPTYDWLDKVYKNTLEKKLISDTIISIAEK